MQAFPMPYSRVYIPLSAETAPAVVRILRMAFIIPHAIKAGRTGIMMPLMNFINFPSKPLVSPSLASESPASIPVSLATIS